MGADWLELILIVGWFLGTLVVSFFVRRARVAFGLSALLFIPEIAYTIFKIGSIEMLGIVHLICAGLYGLVMFYLIRLKRGR